jgi:hypothetical protein
VLQNLLAALEQVQCCFKATSSASSVGTKPAWEKIDLNTTDGMAEDSESALAGVAGATG